MSLAFEKSFTPHPSTLWWSDINQKKPEVSLNNYLPIDTIITFGKYKGKVLSDLIKDINYCNWIIDNNIQHQYLLYDTIKYLLSDIKNTKKQEPVKGINLTQRIDDLLSKYNYDEIIKNIDINIEPVIKTNIISNEFNNFIKTLHLLNPSNTGCFMDYLLRRIISENIGYQFSDNRASFMTECKIGDNKSNNDVNIDIYYRENVNKIIQIPFSFIKAYSVVTDMTIPSINIIQDIFVVSLLHNAFFGNIDPSDDNSINEIIKQFEFINKYFKKEYISEILAIKEIFEGNNYVLNPGLGINGMGADADLIVDDKLMDFKVVKNDKDHRDIIQLLGYTSLTHLRNYKINSIYILNLYNATIKKWDISQWNNHNNLLDCLNLDTSIYQTRTNKRKKKEAQKLNSIDIITRTS